MLLDKLSNVGEWNVNKDVADDEKSFFSYWQVFLNLDFIQNCAENVVLRNIKCSFLTLADYI